MKITQRQLKNFLEVCGYRLRTKDGLFTIMNAARDIEVCSGYSVPDLLAAAQAYIGGCDHWVDALQSELGMTEMEFDGYLAVSGVL